MPRAADILADETTAHVFTLLRVAAGLRVKALAEIESLFTELTTHSEKFGQLRTASGPRFRALEIEAGQIIKAAYKVIGNGQADALERIAVNEGEFVNRAMNKVVGVDVFTKALDPRTLQLIAAGKIIEGHPASAWWDGQSANLRRRFSGEVSKGILLGESTPQIVKRVKGDIAANAAPGLKRKAQADATALVRTSVQAVGNAARIESFKSFETVKGIAWLATLDGRTTIICIALDGKKWRLPDFAPIGHNKAFPGPIAHIQCRSTQTAVTYSWEELSGKKIKELDNRTLQAAIERKMAEAGETPERIDAALANARATMDGYTRASNTFETWAETKPAAFVADVIGPARQELWNSGKITFNDLTDQTNRPLTVAQLEESTASGKRPPETLGAKFIPYKPAVAATVLKVQEIATDARKDAEEKQAAAERQGRELVGELATTHAQQFAGPYADARAAIDGAQTLPPDELRAQWERAAKAAAPDWLKAWENGQATPQSASARPNRYRREAWEKYAKGEPPTLATWEKLWKGWQADKAGEPARRAMDSAQAAVEAAQKKLAAIAKEAKTAPADAVRAALLDASAALEEANSQLADAIAAAAE